MNEEYVESDIEFALLLHSVNATLRNVCCRGAPLTKSTPLMKVRTQGQQQDHIVIMITSNNFTNIWITKRFVFATLN